MQLVWWRSYVTRMLNKPTIDIHLVIGLTPDELKDAEEQFKKYDEDKSGTIDRNEMYKLLVDLNKGKQSEVELRKAADILLHISPPFLVRTYTRAPLPCMCGSHTRLSMYIARRVYLFV